MAKLKIFGVFDLKAGAYTQMFFSPASGLATRSFETAVNDPQTMPGQFPADFSLRELGEVDDNTGLLSPLPAPQHLVEAIGLKRKPEGELPLDSALRAVRS